MKKLIPLFLLTILLYGCLNDNDENLTYEITAIDSFTVPLSFTYMQKDTVKIKYSIDENCKYFNNIYYEYQDSTRIVAVNTVRDLDVECSDSSNQYEYNIIVTAAQEEDYVFKFYKGKDEDGNNIFEEAIVPVN